MAPLNVLPSSVSIGGLSTRLSSCVAWFRADLQRGPHSMFSLHVLPGSVSIGNHNAS